MALTGSLSPKLYIETIHELRRLSALGEAGEDPTKVAVEMLIRMVQFFQHDPLVQQEQLIAPVGPMITVLVNIASGVPAHRFFKPPQGRPREERTTLRPCAAVLVDRLHATGMMIDPACSCVAKAFRRAGVQQPSPKSGTERITEQEIKRWRRALRSHKDDRDAGSYRAVAKLLRPTETEADALALVDHCASLLAAKHDTAGVRQGTL